MNDYDAIPVMPHRKTEPQSISDGNSARKQRELGEYLEWQSSRCDMYWRSVCAGALTLDQAIYACTEELRPRWQRVIRRSHA